MKYCAIYILCLCSLKRSAAQEPFVVELHIKNQIDSLPIPSLVVTLKDKLGNNVKEALTDQKGVSRFLIEDSLCNKLFIAINSTIFETYFSMAIVCAGNSKTQVIYLMPVIKVIDEVRVMQKKVVMSGEKLLYNVKHDRFSPGLSGSDIFRKLPGVTFVSGSVKLNGRDGVLILVDGKGEFASQQEQLALLSSFSLDDILKVEIISSPSARYDVNVTSVINIITKKSKTLATLKAGISQLFYPAKDIFGANYISGTSSANFNFKIKAIRSSLSIGIDNQRTIENSESDFSLKNYLNYNWLNESVSSNFSIRSNLGLNYDIDSNSSIGLFFVATLRPSLLIETSESYSFYNYTTHQLDSSRLYRRTYEDKRNNIRATAQYKSLLNKKNNSFLYINVVQMMSPSEFLNQVYKLQGQNSEPGTPSIFSSKTTVSNASVIITDLIKKTFVSTEVGIKFNRLKGSSSQDINETNNRFGYTENLYSMFGGSRWKQKQFFLLLELRGELLRSNSSVYDQANRKQFVSNSYFKLYPNVLLQWKRKDWAASFGYNKRIRRPFVSDLNPSTRFNGVFQRAIGNTLFQPTYFDKIETQFKYKNLIVTPYLEVVKNRRIFVPGSDPFELIAQNNGKQYVLGLSTSFEIIGTDFFNANLSATYKYINNRRSGVSSQFKQWNHLFLSGTAEVTPAKNTRFQFDLYYQPQMRLEYSVFKPYFASVISVRQLISKDKLSLNFSIADPIGIERNQYNILYPDQTGKYRLRNNNRSISLQLVYNFLLGQKFKQQTFKSKDYGEIRNE